ncbi:MAG: FKBP-type peptidyl-prolyl cis-trans isomerase [Desulfuromonadales bacterium]
MRKRALAAVFTCSMLLLAIGCTAEDNKAAQKVELKDLRDKVSYSIGLNIGRDFKQQDIDIDPALLALGIRDAVSGAEPRLTDEQIQETITAFQSEMMAKQEKKASEMAAKNLKEGESFLAEHAKQEGVITLPSGLQYKVIEEGAGPKPQPSDTVKVNYEGKLPDGTVFDSSYKRGEPATFPVTGVIPGWTEGLQLMKEGAKYEFVIPPALAYGERGAGPVIGPNATLAFTVELLEVNPKEDAAPQDGSAN